MTPPPFKVRPARSWFIFYRSGMALILTELCFFFGVPQRGRLAVGESSLYVLSIGSRNYLHISGTTLPLVCALTFSIGPGQGAESPGPVWNTGQPIIYLCTRIFVLLLRFGMRFGETRETAILGWEGFETSGSLLTGDPEVKSVPSPK